MFLLSSDFDLIPFSLPDLASQSNSFPDYAEEQEARILKKLLGKSFYEEFIAGRTWQTWTAALTFEIGDLATDGETLWESLQAANTNNALAEGAYWTAVTGNKWFNLEVGGDYVWVDDDYEWAGIKDMLKPYIYSMWVKDNYDALTSNGTVVSNTENSTVISPGARIASGYNSFVERAGANLCTENSLYGYLLANEDLFPSDTYEFRELGFMNRFGV